MSKPTCSAADCGKPHKARGLCAMHYSRQKRTGTTDAVGRRGPKTAQRFWTRVEKRATSECWTWTGGHSTDGYGKYVKEYAHRFSWSLHSGQAIPKGLHIDHICHNRSCVNPHHLQVVTVGENVENHNGANRNSKSGIRGVSWHKRKQKWQAQASSRGVSLRQYFDDIDEAAEAVVEMRNRLHTNNLLDRRSA